MKTPIPESLIVVLIVCLGWLKNAQAVVPAPDGVYPNFTTAEGQSALQSLTTGAGNTALGAFSLFSTTTASFNTAVGAGALDLNTGDSNTAVGAAALLLNTGGENTAIGTAALELNTVGSQNTANGAFALFNNTTGNTNTANGAGALFSNTTGETNTATGFDALFSNTTGGSNTANGFNTLFSNTTGASNTANGFKALFSNTIGLENTATGTEALGFNTIGNDNTANGFGALEFNSTGSSNTANGVNALLNNTTGNENTANGLNALFSNTTGNNNVAIGFAAGSNLTGDNNIDIGNPGFAGEANTIRIGAQGTQTATFIAGISGATVTGTAVVVDGSGQLGVAPSSARFKEAIKPMDNASEALFSLKPVTFRYKKEIDPQSISQFGLVAEEVEAVNSDLVVRDKKGKPYTVRYDAVNAMLLNEFLKEHHQIQDLKVTVAEQQKQIEALAAGLQKVSAQLEVSKPAPQTVKNTE